jgi:hypothetical protein
VFQVGAEPFSALRSMDALPGNLPAQLSSFVGRDIDVAGVLKMVGEERLVTLTGPGGVDKTRLALQAAVELAVTFPDGAWLVELADRSLWGSVCDACRYRRLLLVLDNAEHLLAEVADLAVELLTAAPGDKGAGHQPGGAGRPW